MSDRRVSVVVDCGRGMGDMLIDVEDSRPGGVVPGEETDTTALTARWFEHGEPVQVRIPLSAVRAAMARRRFS